MWKKIKQLFCKHKWEEKTIMEVTEDFGGVLQFLEEKRYKVCKKCGKKLNISECTWKY
jgi:hypothetical protein